MIRPCPWPCCLRLGLQRRLTELNSAPWKVEQPGVRSPCFHNKEAASIVKYEAICTNIESAISTGHLFTRGSSCSFAPQRTVKLSPGRRGPLVTWANRQMLRPGVQLAGQSVTRRWCL